MRNFVLKHAAAVSGVLSGFDRIVFRGSLRNIAYSAGMDRYLSLRHILYKDAAAHFEAVTKQVRAFTISQAKALKRPIVYQVSSKRSKEEEAISIANRDGIKEGLIGILSSVEPCDSYQIYRNAKTRHLELRPHRRKCLHYYHYYLHPEFGLMHVRLQTWFPFNIQICINGREWLARKMDSVGLKYKKSDNCFTWLEDAAAAQSLANEQLKSDWPFLLEGFAKQVNPLLDGGFGNFETKYYWTAHQTEWATDVMFKSPADLSALFPPLVRHGMMTFKSPDVLRFLGRKVSPEGRVSGVLPEAITTSMRDRAEGMRIKHWVGFNSVKMYDKDGRVLRVEVTINDARGFRVFRPKEGGDEEHKAWRQMRKGVADMHRRAEVSQACNERYLDALAEVKNEQSLDKCLADLSRPTQLNGRRVRGLNVFAEDGEVLAELAAGCHTLNGFRNRDLQASLYRDEADTQKERRKRSGKVTRILRMLRAHGLIKKVPRSQRYHLTVKGRTAVIALAAAKQSSVNKLSTIAV